MTIVSKSHLVLEFPMVTAKEALSAVVEDMTIGMGITQVDFLSSPDVNVCSAEMVCDTYVQGEFGMYIKLEFLRGVLWEALVYIEVNIYNKRRYIESGFGSSDIARDLKHVVRSNIDHLIGLDPFPFT